MWTRTRGTTSDVTVKLDLRATATLTLRNVDPEDVDELVAGMSGDALQAALADDLELTGWEVDEVADVEPHERDYELDEDQ